MARISIDDLTLDRALDRKAMALVAGAAGAPWVFGWIRPYVEAQPSQFPVINFYQINNYADQMINQYQLVSVLNTGSNANVDVKVDESSLNKRTLP